MIGHQTATTTGPLLTRLKLLTKLEDDDLRAIDALCRDMRTCRARYTVVAQGKPTDLIYVLLDGWACSYRLLTDGRRQITQLFLPGDLCNLDSLHLRHTGQAIGTLTVCTMAAVSLSALRHLIAERPAVARAFGWLAALDNAMLTERNVCLGRRTAREHVAHLFCELLMRLTLVGRARGNGYALPLTQEEIADVLGLTAVHVNRVVQGLRRDGLIDYRGKDLVVRDWSRLRAAARYRADYLHLDGIEGANPDVSTPSPGLPPPSIVVPAV